MRQIVILAGGLATRLYPITKDIPKSMVPVNGKPFLEYQIELCKKNGISEIVLCVGHLWEQISDHFGNGKNYGIKIVYSIEKERLDTGGALKNALPYLDDEFFVMYGDSYLSLDWQEIYSFFKNIRTEGLMTVYENNWQLEPSRVLLNASENLVTEFDKENPRKEMHHMEYGINILPKKIIPLVKETSFPISRYFDMLIERKQLSAFLTKQRFYEIGCPEGLESLCNIL